MIKEFFSFFDIVSAFFVMLLVIIHAGWRRGFHMNEEHYSYFMPSLYFKLLLGITYALFYVIAYDGGGDTVAYWSGAVRLSNLFYESPGEYFAVVFRDTPTDLVSSEFNTRTGYPPSWIYKEQESWLVCKILSIQVITTFKGFFAGTILMVYLAHASIWKLYERILRFNLFSVRNAALAILFIPSVNFWCSGVSKDTLLYVGLSIFTTTFFNLLENPRRYLQYLLLIFTSYVIFNIRSIMLFTVALPMFTVFSRKILNNKDISWLLRSGIRFFSVVFGILVLAFVFSNGALLQSESVNELINEAAIVQQDFSNNSYYGDNRYDLGITDYSITGMLFAFPMAVIAGIYRPFIWEALSPSLLFNGIESMILIFFTIRFFFRKNFKIRFKALFRHELLVYFLITVFFIAFFAGFTSVLFGVLVRIRSFALPFFFLLLLHDESNIPEDEHELSDQT